MSNSIRRIVAVSHRGGRISPARPGRPPVNRIAGLGMARLGAAKAAARGEGCKRAGAIGYGRRGDPVRGIPQPATAPAAALKVSRVDPTHPRIDPPARGLEGPTSGNCYRDLPRYPSPFDDLVPCNWRRECPAARSWTAPIPSCARNPGLGQMGATKSCNTPPTLSRERKRHELRSH